MKTQAAASYPLGVATRDRMLTRVGYAALYTLLIILAVTQLLPLLWLMLFSLKNNQEVFNLPPFALPPQPHWENYMNVWTSGNIGRYFINSVWITVISVALTVLLPAL